MTRWRGLAADVAVTTAMVIELALGLDLDQAATPRLGGCVGAAVLVCAAALLLSHRRPVLAAVMLSALLPGVVALASRLQVLPDDAIHVLPDMALVAVALVAYRVGRDVQTSAGWQCLALMLVGLQGADLLWGEGDPVLTFVVGFGWAGGRVIGSLQAATLSLDQTLAAVRREEVEQAGLAVVTERRRMVRELHDVIGHTMTVIVVQAAAGRHLSRADPREARKSLGAILDAAQSVSGEVDRLRADETRPPGLPDVATLVRVTRDAGTDVALTWTGPGTADADPRSSAAAHDVVREGLTNAMRHAPGAAVRVDLHQDEDDLVVTVRNAAGATGGASTAGSLLGLAGLRDRVEAVGGSFAAGPAPGGGWSVRARLPVLQCRAGDTGPNDRPAQPARRAGAQPPAHRPQG